MIAVQTTFARLNKTIRTADYVGTGAFQEIVQETERFLSAYEVDYEIPKLTSLWLKRRRMHCDMQCRYRCRKLD